MKKNRKQKAQQAVAAVVMGMNLVNTMSPVALAAQMPMQPMQDNMPVPEAKPLEYTSLPQALQTVESIVFGRAEAASDMTGGEQTVSSGESVEIGTMYNGTQYVLSGGSANISDMMGGSQTITGGTGSINNMSGGGQFIHENGSGSINIMYDGSQYVDGIGSINTMDEGFQHVRGGTGIIGVMNPNGGQKVSAGTGIIGTMNGSRQMVLSGAIGSINIMNNGIQQIYSAGNAVVTAMNGGKQIVEYGASGNISAMTGGTQIVSGIGTVETMDGGTQIISGSGSGDIATMNNGTQHILSGGIGSINAMVDGKQIISGGGVGSVDTMNNGLQYVQNDGAVGDISVMNGGSQFVVGAGAVGNITKINDGSQNIWGNNVTGNISTMNGGSQFVSSGATGNIDTMNSGYQSIRESSAKGHINAMSDGNQVIYNGGIGTIDKLDGANGIQKIYAGASGTVKNLVAGTQSVLGGTSIDTVLNGGTQVVSSGTVQKTIINAGIQKIFGGDINNVTLNGGVIHYADADKGNINGLTMAAGTVMLNADGKTYNIKGDFNLTGGTVDMTKVPGDTQIKQTYENLNIDKLTGNGGTFKLNTDLNSEINGDKITISDSDAGTTAKVQVSDVSLSGNMVTENKELLLITDNSGKATFEGDDLNNGGLFKYTPEIQNGAELGHSNKEWYLTHIAKEVNEDTQVLLDGADNAYAMWRNTNDSLRKRLGELHMLPKVPNTDGLWARYIGGKFDGQGFDGQYNIYQLGYDKTDNAKSIYGFALEKGGGNATYEFGSGEDDLFAGSLYGTWLADDGSYTDLVAKIGRFDTEINSYGEYPDGADYSHNAYSISVEYGKNIKLNDHGTYIEPQAQFIAGRLDTVNYTTNRGQKVRIDGVNSYIGRIGFILGQHTPDGNDVYFKANMLHEFGGDGSIAMLAKNGEALSMDKDYGDTWFELGIGTNIKLGHASYFYGDIERGFSGDIDKKWQINAGLRFEF